MLSNCKDAMDNSPIIAAIKDMAGLKKCLTCDSQVIFILFGDICNIADIVILPALMPKVVSRICRLSKVPVITGGLISDKEDVVSMLNAGAVCISSTNPDVWFL